MRKIIFVTLLSLIDFYGKTQDTVKTTVFINDTLHKATTPLVDSAKLTVSKVYNDVKAGLTGLAGALKVGAEHVYGVMVKQQLVYAITWLIFTIAFVWLLLWWIGLIRTLIKTNPTSDTADTTIGVIVAAGFVLIVSFFFVIYHIDTIVMGFVNPEYGAIKDILDFVKN